MKDNIEILANQLQKDIQLEIADRKSHNEIRNALVDHINYLINHDFEKLVFILYRIDVNEKKMKELLADQNGENAAMLITDLIIERQLQKIEGRKKFPKDTDIPDEESW